MRVGVMAAVLALLAFPQSQAFLLVGEDPSGDGHHAVLDAADVGGTVSAARTDVLGVDVAGDDEQVTLRLRFAEAPGGTGGYMYRVVFEAGGALYWTCWTVQWVGGQASEENVKGCSRFTEGTQVGPQVTAPTALDGTGAFAESTVGVERGQVDGQEYVQWPVPRASIGGAGVADLQNVFADTWFRGGSTCCAGSTVDSQYHWSRSDLGPDEGVWSIVVPAQAPDGNGSAGVRVDVTLGAAGPLSIPPGGNRTVTYPVNVTGVGNVTFVVEGVPAGWTVEPVPANLTAPTNATLAVRIQVPADAETGTLEMTLVARSGNTTLASAPLLVEVALFEDGGPDPAGDVVESPGPGALLALGAVGAVAALRRRR